MKKTTAIRKKIPRVVRGDALELKLTPSQYMSKTRLSTDELLSNMTEMRVPRIIEFLDLAEFSHNKQSTVDTNEPLFQPYPSEIVFQKYKPYEVYEIPLVLRNNDQVARNVRVIQEESPYYAVIAPKSSSNKVAPGMEVTFMVQFKPDQRKDYTHELICITEREKFVIPIKSIGARAILDFPDEVNFSTVPVKHTASKTLLIRNVGDRDVNFTLITSDPYTVSPSNGQLEVSSWLQVTIDFTPVTLGDHTEEMVIQYNTGENVFVRLYGAAADANVRLDRNSLTLEKTFIGLMSQRSVTISNWSDVIVHYQWKPLASALDDEHQREEFVHSLDRVEEVERDEFLDECQADPTMRDQMSLLTRTFENRRKAVETEAMLFHDDEDIISIEPVDGEIWPNSQTEVTVSFRPQEAVSYTQTIFLDVTGREERLPLKIRGDGMAPLTQLSFDTLNIASVFVNSIHSYEVILQNKGNIDAEYSLLPSHSLFGPHFTFTPSEGILPPGSLQSIEILFQSPILGNFGEDFYWSVKGATQPLQLYIAGQVIGPTFHFDVNQVAFGTVSYGFVNTCDVTLFNTSEVPMIFHLRIAGTHSQIKEFDINPCQGVIQPGNQQHIQIDFTPATVSLYETALIVDVEGVGKDILTLPVIAKSVVPNVCVTTPLLDFGRCFLYYPYTQLVVLVNETNLPARYELLAHDDDELLSMKYSSTDPKGIIQPHSVCRVSLTIEPCSLDEITAIALFAITGSKSSPLEVELRAIGEGPVVNVRPNSLDWGRCPVLTLLTKTIHLYNEGLIPAKFACQMTHQRTVFQVSPDSGDIAPQTSASLSVTAYVDDCLRFNDRLTITFVFGVSHTIQLSAHGEGTTISCSPPIIPAIDFGPHFSTGPCVQRFTLKNEGRRMQALSWTTQGYSTIKAKKLLQQTKSGSKMNISRPVFQIIPNRFVLDPQEEIDVEIMGHSDQSCDVTETLVCHAIIGKNPMKEKIMETTISAHFISPVLQFSRETLHFGVVQSPGSELKCLRNQLAVANISSLPVTAQLHCLYPFNLIVENGERSEAALSLGCGESMVIEVQFDPAYQPDKHSREKESQLTVSYMEHPHVDRIGLKGCVRFPNLIFEAHEVDFGCILNDTEIIRSLNATNPGPLPIKFSWSFVEFVDEEEDLDSSERDEGIDLRSGGDTDNGTEEEGEEEERETSEAGMDGRSEDDNVSLAEPVVVDNAQKSSVNVDGMEAASLLQPSPPRSHPTDKEWIVVKRDEPTIEQIFDILPLHGVVQPGATQSFEFTFFGHPGVTREVVARCEVDGGPCYDIRLAGQASVVQYQFDRTTVKCGKVLYDVKDKRAIVLTNTGSVPLDYFTLDVASNGESNADRVKVNPTNGHILPGASRELEICFIPGLPEAFLKSFKMQLAHFEPVTITVEGEGVFPHVMLDLPRVDDADSQRVTLKQQAEETVQMRAKNVAARERLESEEREIEAVFESTSVDEDARSPLEMVEVESEIDRLIVREFAIRQRQGRKLHASQLTSKRKMRAHLPDYVLDFSHVILGCSATRIVRITNVGDFPVSFKPDKTLDLSGSGFDVSLRPVRQLPGAPTYESEEFLVKFGTKTTDPLGAAEAYVPIVVSGGPSLGLRLRAIRTIPKMQLSTDTVEFGEVDVGECMIVTIQLYNDKHVNCEWTATSPEPSNKKKANRFIPLHLKRRIKEQARARHFELIPTAGCLHPGDRAYIQAKFTPTEEVSYSHKMILNIKQSSARHILSLTGRGREPRVEFSSTLLEFGPVLPHSVGQELELTVTNPTPVPVEIYSVDFDKRYREEEDILRSLKGYDNYNTLLLPPRAAGEKLPEELVEDYMKQLAAKKTDDAVLLEMEEEAARVDGRSSAGSAESRGLTGTEAMDLTVRDAAGVGELELTSVTRAIARYLGIDLTPEGRGAMNRRGLAIIIDGPPLSGKTTQAPVLAMKYGAALLTVDGVLSEAISTGSTTAAIQAREKCRERATQLRVEIEGGVSTAGNDMLSSSLTGSGAETAFRSRKGSQTSVKVSSQLQGETSGKEVTSATSSTASQSSVRPADNAASAENAAASAETAAVVGELPQSETDADLPPTVLPEEMIVDILEHRLQKPDCMYGVVFDGLDSKYTSGLVATASIILRAFNNRKWIFFVHIDMKSEKAKEREEARRRAAAEKEKAQNTGNEEEEEVRELSEGEYEALSQKEQEEYDKRKLQARKRRIKEKIEREERERKRREQAELEEKRLEEERLAKKGRKGKKDKDRDQKQTLVPKVSPSVSVDRLSGAPVPRSRPPSGKLTAANLSVMLERSESQGSSGDETQQGLKRRKRSASRKIASVSSLVEFGDGKTAEPDTLAELSKRYTEYQLSWKFVVTLLEQWDRAAGTVYKLSPKLPVSNLSDSDTADSVTKLGQSVSQSLPKRGKSRRETKETSIPTTVVESTPTDIPTKLSDSKIQEQKEGIGVPLIQIDGHQDEITVTNTILATDLPSRADILDGMGLGSNGPPLPPPTKFAVVPFPSKRSAATGSTHYTFVTTSADDPNIVEEDKQKPELESESQQLTKDSGVGKDAKKSAPSRAGDDERATRSSKRPTLSSKQVGKKAAKTSNATPPSSAPSKDVASMAVSPQETGVPPSFLLTVFRWVVPANESITLRLRFQSNELGQFDQTLNFELLGTRRKYHLYCRGLCAFPQISKEPRVVFPHRKKTKKEDEIVHKKYIIDCETLEFGPLLLCTKPKDKIKADSDQRSAENLEILTIQNNSPQQCHVKFCLQNDAKGDTFSLHPTEIELQPGESQPLRVWAIPRSEARFEDSIVCCIKENPQPVVFKVACTGVIPRLEPDRKELKFDKMLLHRKNTQILYLRNPCLLPVAWSITGVDMLGDDFVFCQDNGIIEPNSEVAVQAEFRAAKPVVVNKRSVRIDVSDVDKILGTIETFVIYIYAEAYDVAMDIIFPKGADGGLDFGCIRVFDDQKHVVTLRNKSRYDIAYGFEYESASTALSMSELAMMFPVRPSNGKLVSGDKPAQVQIDFKPLPHKEVSIREVPVLKCNIIAVPKIKDKDHVSQKGGVPVEAKLDLDKAGEIIATIPIKLSGRSVFSKYSIHPLRDVNFGALVLGGQRKQRQMTIENQGEFEFRYTIQKMSTMPGKPLKSTQAIKRARSRDGSGRSSQTKITKRGGPDSTKTEGGPQQRLLLNLFTVYPATGVIQPGSTQTITVDCIAETLSKAEELVCVDVSDRDPKDQPDGISYKLMAECCLPGINISDMVSVFEEHRVVRHVGVFSRQHGPCTPDGNVYSEEEKKFYFSSVTVGHKAKARFKLSNPYKVPCDVNMTVKTMQHKSRLGDIFEVEPSKANIPPHSHVFATVTFTPSAMQTYNAQFEALVEGPLSGAAARARSLSFEMCGEGNLPHVTVLQPAIRNKKNVPLLIFDRLLLGHSHTLPLLIKNDGSIPATIIIDTSSTDEAFRIRREAGDNEEGDGDGIPSHSNAITVGVDVNKTAGFSVRFQPRSLKEYRSELRLLVVDNQFETVSVYLVGEGYEDDITVDNFSGQQCSALDAVGGVVADDVSAAHNNHLRFGECFIGETHQISFFLNNRSADAVRFQWPPHDDVTFVPSCGHIHPHSNKNVVATFKATQAKSLEAVNVNCKVCKITYNQPLSRVAEWDDRMRSVKWVPVISLSPPGTAGVVHDTAGDVQMVVPESSPTRPATSNPPTRRKVIETEEEPQHKMLDETIRELDMRASGVADYSLFSCDTTMVRFRDTYMFQTRAYAFTLTNSGNVRLSYRWSVLTQHDEIELNSRPGTALGFRSIEVSDGGSFVSDGGEIVPFSVEPIRATLAPGETSTVTVRFSPLEAGDFEQHIKCNMTNLAAHTEPLVIRLLGCSLMPYCHFELENSDYLTAGRRNSELRTPGGLRTSVDSTSRVIEIFSCGVGVKISKRFHIVNPTNGGYEFVWNCADGQLTNQLRCLTPRGHVAAGKKAEIVFDFISSSLETMESLWGFSIPRLNISIPFLLVGHTSEPAVNMDRSSVNFRSMLVRHTSRDTVHLVNNESTPFHFSVDEASCYADEHSARLVLEPMSGTIQPHSHVAINVTFTPMLEQEYNFNVQCHVRRKPSPITLNVKAEGYAVRASLVCEDVGGAQKEIIAGTVENVIDFGDIQINERSVRQISLINSGRFGFEYAWELNGKCERRGGAGEASMVAVKPPSGLVASNNRVRCEISICPPKTMDLSVCQLACKIVNGPSFSVRLRGRCTVPLLGLSFTKHHFGPCFVYCTGVTETKTALEIINNEPREISLSCVYPGSPHLEVQLQPCVLASGEKTTATLLFHPQHVGKYRDVVPFEVNGLSRVDVEITGEGVAMMVEVAKPAHRQVNFGALRVGQKKSETLELVNKSVRDVSFSVSVVATSNVPSGAVTITPQHEMTLKAHGGSSGSTKVTVTFAPLRRMKAFSQEVVLETAGLSQRLFMVTGCCHGVEFTLNSGHIPFGAVVKGGSSVRKVIINNVGDIGANFCWQTDKLGADFSISPAEGYLAPGMETSFDVTFHPKDVNHDIRKDNVPCKLWIVEKRKEGKENRPIVTQCDPLYLTLTGMAIGQQQMKEQVIQFSSHVRMKDVRNITLKNFSQQAWTNIQPVIDGEYWTGADSVTLEPGCSCQYELTYRPLVMTTDQKKHQGSIFFPLPDGSGLYYTLLGQADSPKPSGNISREVPCKTAYTQLLTVSNWLKHPQRFRATIDILKPDRPDATTTLKGLDYIDVPAKSKKEYKLHFYAHKEGSINAKVMFKNEQTGEFSYYHVAFKATAPEVMSTIQLSTPARQVVSRQVKLKNPLQAPVTFQTSCNVPDISLPPNFTIPPKSDGSFTFEYMPLKVGEVSGRLTLTSNDLGQYHYDLALTAVQPAPERPVHFTTGLGSSQTQACRFVSFARQKAEFSCKVDNPDFHVEKAISSTAASAGGSEVGVEVSYEPGRLGDCKASLTVSSPSAGDYIIPLFGHCVVPKPQGPFMIKAGSSYQIPFKNVFSKTATFTYTLDSHVFTVKFNETIKSKKTHNLIVSYEPQEEASKSSPAMAKLVVTCSRSAVSGVPNIQWTYYLKGIVPY